MITYRILFSALIVVAAGFTACSEDPWSDDEQSKFLESCEAEEASPGYCECYMERTMERYPRVEDATKISFEEAVEISKECE